ncbi:Lrp/AsnC family transcriptional regulator [Mobilicoccus pelagius]|uniref:Putative AsnC family transcriptional regulator n=1 Tax=Mobilicoccus pelagius NBRC 104925 TaxID=1089455 RepID=H5UMG5_9MICO|nr:Lrp/AsnC family transcriptional regulator [Mobilicoccus pelagius]GAB46923.1 putative AsnC family transcriptional regulator [Mobilicoccus pelagius NBRC 104925]
MTRQDDPRPLDEVDRTLLALLEEDGRMSNAQLARESGLAESTCLARVRSLRERGVIRGVHADVDPATVGRGVEAIVAVRFAGHARADIEEFTAAVPDLPGVVSLLHVSGGTDFYVHVAQPTAGDLRDFVLDHLTTRSGVAHAETSLIFDSRRGRRPLSEG